METAGMNNKVLFKSETYRLKSNIMQSHLLTQWSDPMDLNSTRRSLDGQGMLRQGKHPKGNTVIKHRHLELFGYVHIHTH